MNILFLGLFLLFDMSLVLLSFRLYGKTGLLVTYILHIFMSQLTINIPYSIFHYTTIIGSCFYAVLFLTVDMLNEHYGKEEANKVVNYGVFTLIVLFTIFFFIRLLIKENVDNYSIELLDLTKNQLRIIVVDILISYFLFQKVNVLLFDKIKARTGEKMLWLRNNVSTIISQVFTAIMFYELSFAGILSQKRIWQIIITGLIVKIIVSLFETPFLYISKKIGG